MKDSSISFRVDLSVGKEGKEVFPVPDFPVDRAWWLLNCLKSLCRLSEIELTRVRALRIRYYGSLYSQEPSRWLN